MIIDGFDRTLIFNRFNCRMFLKNRAMLFRSSYFRLTKWSLTPATARLFSSKQVSSPNFVWIFPADASHSAIFFHTIFSHESRPGRPSRSSHKKKPRNSWTRKISCSVCDTSPGKCAAESVGRSVRTCGTKAKALQCPNTRKCPANSRPAGDWGWIGRPWLLSRISRYHDDCTLVILCDLKSLISTSRVCERLEHVTFFAIPANWIPLGMQLDTLDCPIFTEFPLNVFGGFPLQRTSFCTYTSNDLRGKRSMLTRFPRIPPMKTFLKTPNKWLLRSSSIFSPKYQLSLLK